MLDILYFEIRVYIYFILRFEYCNKQKQHTIVQKLGKHTCLSYESECA